MTDPHKKDIDNLSGMETTGHEWDGLKELNNPLPRWWLWLLYVTIAWSIVYFVMYPSWPVPGGNTEGTLGYTQYKELAASQQEIVERQQKYLARFENASTQMILDDQELYAFAYRGGETAFKDNCATCHMTGGAGADGFPSLVDDDWLWGGSMEEIEQTIRYGIRANHDETRFSEMPAFGRDEILTRDEIGFVADHILSLRDAGIDGNEQGALIFEEQCSACHAADGTGDRLVGAPNLVDAIALYGNGRADIIETIYNARYGVMPTWEGRLDNNTIRQLAFYVHQLGGGETVVAEAEVEAAPLSEEVEEAVEAAVGAEDAASENDGGS